jgi:hypothetical protein
VDSGSHPSVDQLERFMRGELASAEAAIVVRHLIKGCEACLTVTRPLWAPEDVDRIPKEVSAC